MVKKQELYDYLNQQFIVGSDKIKRYLYNNNRKNPQRNCFVLLQKHLKDYQINHSTGQRIVILYGLRGTGKTTLLAQLYNQTNVSAKRKLFISLDEVVNLLNVSLSDVLDEYQEILDIRFEQLKEPIFLFLDEVHFDKNWANTLKILYDKTDKVFVMATGSNALSLQNTPDLARRSVSIPLYPMKFTEYIKLKYGIYEEKGLASDLKNIIFNSKNAIDVFWDIKRTEQSVKKYWSKVDYQKEVDRYIQYNNLPFAISIPDDGLISDQVRRIMQRIITEDIPHRSDFSIRVLNQIPHLLYMVASADQFSVSSVSEKIDMDRLTLTDVLSAIEETGMLWRVYPYASHYKQVRQPSKYLFMSPTFRTAYFSLTQSVAQSNNQFMGKLLEDMIGLIIKREDIQSLYRSITYDSASGGADFIIQRNNTKIVVEVGYGNKKIDQVVKTMNRVGTQNSYGVVVSKNPLKLHQNLNIIEVPITYFLLI